MSSGLYAITTRASGTILTAAIYNSDHQNHVTNQNPSQTGAYSDNVAQMQSQVSPGTVGGEVLASSLAGEFERLRFVLARAFARTFWYDAPLITLLASTKAQMETGTDTATIPVPAQVKNHQGVAKASGYVNSTGTLVEGYGLTSASRLALGRYQFIFATSFANAAYRIEAMADAISPVVCTVESRAVGNAIIDVFNTTSGAAADANISASFFGKQ